MARRLACRVQAYDWGMAAPCEVAALSGSSGPGPFAELWLGTHPSGPSSLSGGEGSPLSAHIAADPGRQLGSEVHARRARTRSGGEAGRGELG